MSGLVKTYTLSGVLSVRHPTGIRKRDMPVTSRDFLNWFAGFVDGEGSFQIKRSIRQIKPPYKSITVALGIDFNISLRADDKPVLDFIRDNLGFGRVIYIPKTKYRYNGSFPNSKDQYMFRTARMDDCASLVKIFDAYPLHSKKARDFTTWKEAVQVVVNSKGRKSKDRLYLNYLYEKLVHERKYGNNNFPVYSNNYIPNIPKELIEKDKRYGKRKPEAI